MGSLNTSKMPTFSPIKPTATSAPVKPATPMKFDTQKMGAALQNKLIPGGTPSFMPISADPNKTYANPYATPNYQRPDAGPGGAVWGGGGGGENRYDHEQQGSGLWSVGIDRNSPTAINDAVRWYQAQDAGTRAELGAIGGKNMNDPTKMLDVIDQRQRDVARRIKIETGFFDTLPGQILGAGLTMAGGALGGPLGGALAGGLTGGLATKSPLGGVLGAIGGGLGAMTPGASFKTILTKPVTAAKQIAAGKLTPQGIGSTVAGGLGGATKR